MATELLECVNVSDVLLWDGEVVLENFLNFSCCHNSGTDLAQLTLTRVWFDILLYMFSAEYIRL